MGGERSPRDGQQKPSTGSSRPTSCAAPAKRARAPGPRRDLSGSHRVISGVSNDFHCADRAAGPFRIFACRATVCAPNTRSSRPSAKCQRNESHELRHIAGLKRWRATSGRQTCFARPAQQHESFDGAPDQAVLQTRPADEVVPADWGDLWHTAVARNRGMLFSIIRTAACVDLAYTGFWLGRLHTSGRVNRTPSSKDAARTFSRPRHRCSTRSVD